MRSSAWARVALLAACGVGALAQAAAAPSFPTPEAAVQALVDAARTGEDAKVLAVLGGGAKSLVGSGDPVADRNAHERFVGLYEEDHALIAEGDDRRILQIGATQWPFPIPVVKGKAGWSWDTTAGVEELLARRIGQNELNAIQVCLAISDAENEYLALNPQNASPPHYADKFISSKGKRDGLYWPTAEGELPSPLGPGAARATSEGYKLEHGKPSPYHGYLYRILTAQGPHAEGGAVSYLVNGVLYGGFALLGYPAEYRKSGVMTFIVNHHGVVFQKDLGQDTASQAKAMKLFDPDPSWTKVP
jgi:hypothetical protein